MTTVGKTTAVDLRPDAEIWINVGYVFSDPTGITQLELWVNLAYIASKSSLCALE